MPPKRRSSAPAVKSERPRTASTGTEFSASTSATAVESSRSSQAASERPLDSDDVRTIRAELDDMGYKEFQLKEPLERDQVLANMVIRLCQSFTPLTDQIVSQGETIASLTQRVEQLSAQHVFDRTQWEAERFTSGRMMDALLGQARAEDGVRTQHLERECSRALSENYMLQSRLQEALARSRAAEEQLMILRPYLLYGQRDPVVQQQQRGVGPALPPLPPTYKSAPLPSAIPLGPRPPQPSYYRSNVGASSSMGPTTAKPPVPVSSATALKTAQKPKPAAAKRNPSGSVSSMVASADNPSESGKRKSPDSLDDLITAAQHALDSESAAPSLPRKRKADELSDGGQGRAKQSALDVLVAVAFAGDSSETGSEKEAPFLVETDPTLRRSQRNRKSAPAPRAPSRGSSLEEDEEAALPPARSSSSYTSYDSLRHSTSNVRGKIPPSPARGAQSASPHKSLVIEPSNPTTTATTSAVASTITYSPLPPVPNYASPAGWRGTSQSPTKFASSSTSALRLPVLASPSSAMYSSPTHDTPNVLRSFSLSPSSRRTVPVSGGVLFRPSMAGLVDPATTQSQSVATSGSSPRGKTGDESIAELPTSEDADIDMARPVHTESTVGGGSADADDGDEGQTHSVNVELPPTKKVRRETTPTPTSLADSSLTLANLSPVPRTPRTNRSLVRSNGGSASTTASPSRMAVITA